MEKFVNYLVAKRIDATRFRQELPVEWEASLASFAAHGPKAFTQRKRFFINSWRLQFPYQEVSET